MKKFTVLVLSLVLSLSLVVSAYAELYPHTAIVTALEYDENLVVFTDYCGFDWVIEGIEDWDLEDVASLLMDDNGTSDAIFDDLIIMALYAGRFE